MWMFSPGEYRCPICGALLATDDVPECPIAVLPSRGGELTQRVVVIAGSEIHQMSISRASIKDRVPAGRVHVA